MLLCLCVTAQGADFSFRGSAEETTAALQAALDAGGTVRVKPVDYEITGLTLKSGTTLHLETGARLLSQRDNIRFENVELTLLEPDARPAFVTDDAAVSQRSCKFE